MKYRFALLFLALAGNSFPSIDTCAPLPPPSGTIVSVSTVPELENAVASLTSGTTILIADGIYDLTQPLVIGGGVQGVAVRGASGDRDAVVLRGMGMSDPTITHGFLVRNASDVLIADLTIRDVYYHNVQIQGEQNAQRVRLYNLRLVDGGEQLVKVSTAGPPGPYADDGIVECSVIEFTDRARSDYTNGVDVLAGANWIIRDNIFRNIRAPVGFLAGPTVLMWRNCLDSVVERNLFIECDRGVAFGLSTPDANSRDGEQTYDHQGGVIRNNMIYRAAGGATGDVGITVNYARDYRIYHNTVILNGSFFWTIEYRFASSNGFIVNNLTDGNIFQRDGAGGSLQGNVTNAQPDWFQDAAAGDLHLVSTAAGAIDRGVPLPEVTDDYDRQIRPVGSAPDAGADEYGCVLPGGPVRMLRLVKANNDDIVLSWDPVASVAGCNIWYVTRKQDIDLARIDSAPPAVPVAGCAPPSPASGSTCTDSGAITRNRAEIFFYQVRAYCGGLDEGP